MRRLADGAPAEWRSREHHGADALLVIRPSSTTLRLVRSHRKPFPS